MTVVPSVHPVLYWTYARPPRPTDLITPNIDLRPGDTREVYEDFLEDLERLELRPQRVYDTRRSLMSLAMSGGASKAFVKRIPPPRPADVFDLYVTPSWEALCSKVQLIEVELRGEVDNVVALSVIGNR